MAKIAGQTLNKNLELYRVIGRNIKFLRIELEVSQEAISELICVSKSTLCRIEGGKTRIEHGVMLAIADLLCLPSVECLNIPDYHKQCGREWREMATNNINVRRKAYVK